MFVNAKQKRIRGLSIIEQHELRDEPWFQNGVPREISLEVLRRKSPGDFLVRESTSKPGCFALSLRAPPPAPRVVHYLILRTPRGYKIKVISFISIVITRFSFSALARLHPVSVPSLHPFVFCLCALNSQRMFRHAESWLPTLCFVHSYNSRLYHLNCRDARKSLRPYARWLHTIRLCKSSFRLRWRSSGPSTSSRSAETPTTSISATRWTASRKWKCEWRRWAIAIE